GQGPGDGMHRHHHGPRGGFMKHLDENRDGQISRDEVLSSQKRQLAMFERADANGDGTVSRDEMRAAREAMRSEFRKRDGQGCGDGERRGRGAPPAAAPSSQAPAADGKV
ncbi:MAG TPA: EF-hand domain-containing protein, partial [Quisquiliibacterium sp.]|nr:EF-hand domain-containing protein [Quisquiliibacterium sp.]